MTGAYAHWRLPQLWAMVADEDGVASAYHLMIWERQLTLLDEQSARLRRMRDQLAAAWPPDKSTAAAAFLDRVTDMIHALTWAGDSSVRVREGLRHTSEALERARAQLAPLVAQYHDTSAAWRSFNRDALPLLPESLVPSTPTLPGADSLVLAAHQKKLDDQARQIMEASDVAVAQAHEAIATRIPPYGRLDGSTPSNPSTERVGVGPRTSKVGSAPPATVAAMRFDPPATAVAASPSEVGAVAEKSSLIAATELAANVSTRGEVTREPVALQPFTVTGKPPQESGSSWRTPTASGRMAMRPGGVIGEPPPSSAAPPVNETGPTTDRPDAGHPANPGPAENNLITGPTGVPPGVRTARSGTGSTGQKRALTSHVIGAPSTSYERPGWHDDDYEAYVRRRRVKPPTDPNHPWPVAEGVSPLIEPSPERPHDPGPGVIGLDR
jgi:hypothetical protein